MLKLKKDRSILRRVYTAAEKELEKSLSEDDAVSNVHADFDYCSSKADALFKIDSEIKDMWLMDDADEDEMFADIVTTESYVKRWYQISTKYRRKYTMPSNRDEVESVASIEKTNVSEVTLLKQNQRRFNLPKIQLRQFDGNINNFLSFWGQFQKIHNDPDIDSSDKFQYLVQATEQGSKARQLVDSFPPSGENYESAIKELKDRFARDDLLIENYIRGLLQLILSQNKVNMPLRDLYDKLSTQLHALSTLKVTTDKYTSILMPMVESAIPTDILRIWERTRDKEEKNQLEKLLSFIRKEVESEERIEATKSGFGVNEIKILEPTSSCIVANEKVENICIWCDKQGHSNIECYKLSKLTLEQKRDILKKKNACTICLKLGHYTKKCKSFPKCLICGKRHLILICPDLKSNNKNEEKKNQDVLSQCHNNNITTYLQTILVQIVYSGKSVITRALFDSGAQRSYIRKDITQNLGMTPIDQELVSHYLFGGHETKRGKYNNFQFTIKSLNNNFQLNISALDQQKICGPLPFVHSKKLNDKLRQLNIHINQSGNKEIEVGILLGADVLGYLMTGNIIEIEGSLVAIESKLGWTLQGPCLDNNNHINSSTSIVNFTLTELWNFESLGIRDPSDVKNKEMIENDVMKFYRNNVTRKEDGRYEVKLPWKEGFPEFLEHNNKELSYNRLKSVTKRLQLTGNLKNYDNIFHDWVAKGIIEKVSTRNCKGLYLPHHAVFKETSSTTPIRPVFDASAKTRSGSSLNKGLEKGVNLIELIPKLLINFRKGVFGIVSDIRKAFLQISIHESDRDYLQFLWWENIDDQKTVISFRHRRLVFGLTCSPFLLSATLNYHLDNINDERKEIANTLKSSFYVDNCVTSMDSEGTCINFIKVSKDLMCNAKFELCDWVSGPSKVSQTVSVLGMIWENKSDCLFVNPQYNDIKDNNNITKRILLSFSQRIFDPVGYTSPVALIPKLLLQKSWKLPNCDWDQKLPEQIIQEFLLWFNKLEALRDIHIPRRLTKYPMNECSLSLHTFCDASKNAYAACVYLRSEYKNDIHVQLIISKSRVAPIKEVTIPRLELISAVIGVRLYKLVVDALKIKCDSYFWTDSTVALSWIKREGNWSVFVRNRVKEIITTSSKEQWQHVSGCDNPADSPSRGCHANKLKSSKWWLGPDWLRSAKINWPKLDMEVDEQEVNEESLQPSQVTTVSEKCIFSNRFSYFSKYTKIVRSMAWILRFVHNSRFRNDKHKGDISYDEYVLAELSLIKILQKESFENKKWNMKTILDLSGIIRVQTRLMLSSEPDNFKTPILLPGGHFIVHRLIYYRHCQLQHAGTAITVTNIRQDYWITSARQTVNKVISACMLCKRFRCKPAYVPTGQLPENRINLTKVFNVVGIDLAGPLLLRTGDKCWVVIFTCAVYRAVHLELTMSLSTEIFLMALRRFIARRGRVSVIYSDNGTNFVGACNQLKELDWDAVQAQSTIQQIKWQFNPLSSPWWGGFWERLIRTLKDLLRRMLGTASLKYVEMETLLIDCEGVLNSRPLTYVPANETLEPLSPACFLHDNVTSDVCDLNQIDSNSLNMRLRYVHSLRLNLKERFRNEYLALLIQKDLSKNASPLNVSDVVLVETDRKRQFWPIGVIQEVFTGRDGLNRVAKVKISGATLTRPFQRLYPLELRHTDKTIIEVGKKVIEKEVVTRAGRKIKPVQRLDI